MLDDVRKGLVNTLDAKLVDELLAAYADMKHNFYLGGLRLSEVEGGRFCEAAFRILEQVGLGKVTPLGTPLDTEKLIQKLKDLPQASALLSVRLHIPRALRVVYDVRNARDVAHLADGIDPNIQDATLVMGVLDWVLAEFVRIYHSVKPDEAQRIIERMVTRKAPAVEDFDGFLKVLRKELQVGDYLLLLLFECGKDGASYDQLETWAHPKMRKNMRRALHRLVNDERTVHQNGIQYFITKSGIAGVEGKGLHK
jgi:hypothetical protein